MYRYYRVKDNHMPAINKAILGTAMYIERHQENTMISVNSNIHVAAQNMSFHIEFTCL